jgi:hypothetical protein
MAFFISTTLFAWIHTLTSIVASSSRNDPFSRRSLYQPHGLALWICYVASRFLQHFYNPVSVHCYWGAYLDASLSRMIYCINTPILSTYSNNLVFFRPYGLQSSSW